MPIAGPNVKSMSGKVDKSYSSGAVVPGDVLTRGKDADSNPIYMLVSSSISRSLCTEHRACGVALSSAPYDTLNPDGGFGSANNRKTWGGGTAASQSSNTTTERAISYANQGPVWLQVSNSTTTASEVTGAGSQWYRIQIDDYVRGRALARTDDATGVHTGVVWTSQPGMLATTSTTAIKSAALITVSQVYAYTVSTIINDRDVCPSTVKSVAVQIGIMPTASVNGDAVSIGTRQLDVTASTATTRRQVVANSTGAAGRYFYESRIVELDENGAFWVSASPADSGFTLSINLTGYEDDERTVLGRVLNKKVDKDDNDYYWGTVLVDLNVK